MITTISTRSGKWRLHDEYNNDKSIYCDVNVKIEKKKYVDNREFYYIHYYYSYSEESYRCYNIIPLNKDNIDGEIIAVNSLSDELCKYLLMSIGDIEEYSGSVSGECYKKSIMVIVTHLWD